MHPLLYKSLRADVYYSFKYGESEEYGLDKGPKSDPKTINQMMKHFSTGEIDAKGVKKETAANRLLGERHCTTCNFPAKKAGVATLSACQKCKEIGRLVFYCSK